MDNEYVSRNSQNQFILLHFYVIPTMTPSDTATITTPIISAATSGINYIAAAAKHTIKTVSTFIGIIVVHML